MSSQEAEAAEDDPPIVFGRGTRTAVFFVSTTTRFYAGAAEEGGGGKGGFSPPKFSDRSDDDMLPYISTCTPLICLMYLASSRGGTSVYRCVRYLRSASLTSLLHFTMHASHLELGSNSQALILFLWSQADPSQSVKVKLFDRGTRS